MPEIAFNDLKFEEAGNAIVVTFLDNFYFEIQKNALGNFQTRENKITFRDMTEKEARNRLNSILDGGFLNLTSKTTKNPATYINKYSGLPLIGSAAFGIVDRNSNMLEVKPLTGCNMNCVFCSVDEGLASRKTHEIVIDKDHLSQETAKAASTKECDVHVTINAHGEPTLYKPMPELVEKIAKIKNVKTTTIITNCTLLNEEYVDKLTKAGLTALNVSLNAISSQTAKILEGHGKYDVEHVKKTCEYAAKKIQVVLAPVFVPGYNDNELSEIIKFAKKIGAKAGIQNYLYYKKGRNPVNAKQMPWSNFYEKLKKLEKKHDFKLILDEKDFGIVKTKPLPKPFKKNQIVEATIKCPGRYENEVIAAAKNRNVTITNFNKGSKSKVKIKITSDKHNLFFAKTI